MWAIYGSPTVFGPHLKSLVLSELGFELLMQISWLHINVQPANLHNIFLRFKAHHVGGARDGTVERVLASHQCGPGSNPGVDTICGLSLFVVGSLLCSERFFFGYSVFPSPQNPTLPNSNSTRNKVDEEPLSGCATSKSLFIYLFIFI